MYKTKLILPLFITLVIFSNCTNSSTKSQINKSETANHDSIGLYKVVIFYPKTDSTRFDMDYYENNHMPMMAGILGDNLEYYEIDNGKVESNNNPPYIAIGSFYVKDIDKFNESVSANSDSVRNDIPKYTNEKPIVQTLTTKKFYK